jgi:hypothetical protein
MIEGELIGFHWGTLDDATRARVEEHLGGCLGCVRAYLDVKRALEREPPPEERPSELLKARLRADVARRFGRRRALAWAGGAAAAATAAAIALVLLLRPITSPTGSAPAPAPTDDPSRLAQVDTAAPASPSLNVW